MSSFTTFAGAFAARTRRVSAVALLLAVATLAWNALWSAQAQTPPPPNAPAAAPLPPEQVDQLLAPIALYPDNLLGQVLTASTYPLEIVMASRWSAANPNVTGQALEDAMQAQPWDPSVKALCAVPQVLQMMNDKIEWTQQVGELYLAQPDGIAAAVQRLRAHADASGNLKPSDQVKVRRVPRAPPPTLVDAPPPPPEALGFPPGPDYIVIEPVDPAYMYVPVYDPFLVYGVWPYPAYRPFYWYPPGYVSVGIFAFGAPIVVGAALWANYNWYSRRVEVNAVNYSRFNHVTLAATNKTWQHDPGHRGNIPYHNAVLQQQFGKAAATNFKGSGNLGNQKLLNTNIGNQKLLNTNIKGATGTGTGMGKERSVNQNANFNSAGSMGGTNTGTGKNISSTNSGITTSNSGITTNTGTKNLNTNNKNVSVSNAGVSQKVGGMGSGGNMGTPGGGIGPAMGGGPAPMGGGNGANKGMGMGP